MISPALLAVRKRLLASVARQLVANCVFRRKVLVLVCV
jgi:hypothetical protein